jgi:uncharacterized protein DUF4349
MNPSQQWKSPRRALLAFVIMLAALVLLVGCAKHVAKEAAKPAAETGLAAPDLASHNFHGDRDRDISASDQAGEVEQTAGAVMDGASAPAGSGKGAPAKANLPRKMVFNADVQVVITDKTLDDARVQLKGLLKTHDALVTSEDVSGTTGVQRTGRWTIRVPAERFDAFVEALRGIGIVDRQVTKSQEVTEEFYDLQGRIKQKRAELDNLTNIMKKAGEILEKDPKARMEDYLAIEKRWEEVQAVVERMEGRLKVLTNLTDLTTVTLTIQERKSYTPPETTFTGRIGQTWGDSLEKLQSFGQGLVLFGVGLTPWLPVIAVIVVPLVFLIRRSIKSSRSVPVAVAAEK